MCSSSASPGCVRQRGLQQHANTHLRRLQQKEEGGGDEGGIGDEGEEHEEGEEEDLILAVFFDDAILGP